MVLRGGLRAEVQAHTQACKRDRRRIGWQAFQEGVKRLRRLFTLQTGYCTELKQDLVVEVIEFEQLGVGLDAHNIFFAIVISRLNKVGVIGLAVTFKRERIGRDTAQRGIKTLAQGG